MFCSLVVICRRSVLSNSSAEAWILIPNNGIPIFNEMATSCDVSIPVTTVDDFRFVLSTYFEDARRSRARTISYRWAVTGTLETHHGDIKAVSFKEKIHGNSSISGNNTLSISRAESVLCHFCGKNNHSNADCRTRTSEFANNQKTIILSPIVVREPQTSRTIKTVLMSVRRPMVG